MPRRTLIREFPSNLLYVKAEQIYEYSDREVDAAPAMLRVQKDKHTRVRDRVP